MPKGIRPTQQKIRKAIFDILGDIKGLSFLELFAGSGAVGIEAISCGAKEAVFVEKDQKCVKIIRDNLALLGCLRYRVIALDILKAIKQFSQKNEKFDIIFLDPPYCKDLAKKTLQTLAAYDILTPYGLVVIQHFKKDDLPDKLGVFTLFKQKRYGDTLLSFYKKLC